jgi:DEAD/DEAH box helicase domain-containing protein
VYKRQKWYTHENIGSGELELPPTRLNTTAYWFSLEEVTVIKLRELGAWGADPIIYGQDWNIQKKLARERDGFRCQVCGIIETGRAHDVHHKIPFRQFQTYKQANRLENLVTLCSTCHKRVETNVRIQSGLAGLAFTLSHLAPIYLMSDRRDIGVHSDPQSTLADGYPTIIIYDQIPDGIGFSMRLFELHDEIIDHASNLVQSCQCKDGCPSCVGPGGEFGHGGKHDAIQILSLLSYPTDH